MTRVVRNAALLCIGGILLASAALANVPDPSKCTLGSNYPNASFRKYIAVEGYNPTDSLPDRPDVPASASYYGDYEVTVKDNGGVAIAGATVCIDFSNCPDIQISGNQLVTKSPGYATSSGSGPNGSAQQLIGCSTVCGSTNAAGKYMFKVQGKAINVKTETGNHVSFEGTAQLAADTTVAGCAAVTANLVPLGNLKTWIYDVNTPNNGDGTVSGTDATLVAVESVKIAAAANPALARSRDDYNRSGTLTGSDASISAQMATQAAAGSGSAKTQARASYCP